MRRLYTRLTFSTMAALLLCSNAADPDKVAAAQEVLDRVAAASPAARAVVREMGDLIDGYIELVGGGLQRLPGWLCVLACSCSAMRVYAPSMLADHALLSINQSARLRPRPNCASHASQWPPRPRCLRPPKMPRRWPSRGACAAHASECPRGAVGLWTRPTARAAQLYSR